MLDMSTNRFFSGQVITAFTSLGAEKFTPGANPGRDGPAEI